MELLPVLAGCAGEDGRALLLDRSGDMVRVPAKVLEASRRGAVVPYAKAQTTLFLNFDGAKIVGSGSSDASKNSSFIGSGTIPPFSGTSSTKNNIVDMVKLMYKDFNVQIVTQRPSSGDYDMVMVGGTPEDIGLGGGGIVGVAPMDCDNEMPRDLCFAFSDSVKSYASSEKDYVEGTAETIAHESGHTYGLPHSDDGCDLMSYDTCSKTKMFLDKTVGMQSDSMGECGLSSMNSHKILIANLGASTGTQAPPPPDPSDTEPPVVTITSPASGAVEADLVVGATIIDNKGVIKAELLVDGTMVSSRTATPFDFSLHLSPGPHSILVRGYDLAGNKGEAAVLVAVETSQTPPPPPDVNRGAEPDADPENRFEGPLLQGGCSLAAESPAGHEKPMPLGLELLAVSVSCGLMVMSRRRRVPREP